MQRVEVMRAGKEVVALAVTTCWLCGFVWSAITSQHVQTMVTLSALSNVAAYRKI